MMLTFATIHETLGQIHDDAMRLRRAGSFREADLIDQTLARTFFWLLRNVNEESVGLRVLRQLLDLGTSQPIDALAQPEYALAAVRLTAASVLPEVEVVTGLDQIRAVINSAIMIGAPTYNAGDARSCGITYWTTSLAIVSAPTLRGFAGQARALKPLRQSVEEPIPPIGQDARAVDEFAWRMRRGLDAALAVAG